MAVIAGQLPRWRRALADNLERISFHLSWIRKRQLLRRRRELQTVHDYFRFSRKVFKPVQIEEEITGFLEHIQKISPAVVCEIGTRSCGTSFLLSQAVSSVQAFIGLDLYVSNWSQFRTFTRPGQEVAALIGSSCDPTTVQRLLQVLHDRPIDVLFIDGDHAYEGAKTDFLLYRHMVREGGIIALHDINRGPNAGGVPTLWSRIKAAYPHVEFIADAGHEGFGIGAITYSNSVQIPEL